MRSQKNLTSEDISTKSICLHHHAFFLRKFSSHVSKNCCDIFGIHQGKRPKGSCEINIKLAKALAPFFLISFLAINCVLLAIIKQNRNQLRLALLKVKKVLLEVIGSLKIQPKYCLKKK